MSTRNSARETCGVSRRNRYPRAPSSHSVRQSPQRAQVPPGFRDAICFMSRASYLQVDMQRRAYADPKRRYLTKKIPCKTEGTNGGAVNHSTRLPRYQSHESKTYYAESDRHVSGHCARRAGHSKNYRRQWGEKKDRNAKRAPSPGTPGRSFSPRCREAVPGTDIAEMAAPGRSDQ